MITIHAFGSIPIPVRGLTRDLRALWAAEEAGLAYEIRPVDSMSGGLSSEDYLAVSPFGLIPAMEDGAFSLFESGAIVFYIADKAGKLVPADAEGRALAMQWALVALNTLEPAAINMAVVERFHAGESWAEERRPAVRELCQKRLATLDSQLAGKRYLLGEDFSAADILMTSVLRFIQYSDLIETMPNLAAYKARCEDRPAWAKVLETHDALLAA